MQRPNSIRGGSTTKLNDSLKSAIRETEPARASLKSSELRRKMEAGEFTRLPGLTGDYSEKDRELVRGYIRRAITNLNISEVETIISRTGIVMNWTSEEQLVNQCYDKIAERVSHASGPSVTLNKNALRDLGKLHKITNIEIPESAKERALNALLSLLVPSAVFSGFKIYDSVIGKVPEKMAEALALAVWVPGYSGKERIKEVYALLGLNDSGKADELIAKLQEKALAVRQSNIKAGRI